MNNIGFGEILVLFLLGLVVFGPNKLPEIARNLGKAMNAFRTETEKARRQLREIVDDANVTKTIGAFDTADPPKPVAPPPPSVTPAAPVAAPSVAAPSVSPAQTPQVTQGDFDVMSSNGYESDSYAEPTSRELEDT